MIKYPRTFHLPWSAGITNDDKVLNTVDFFKDKEIVVTTKMDGENTTLTCERLYARSLDSRSHPSRDWVKTNVWSRIKLDIPPYWRICGENLFAQHSIIYDDLTTYFYGFSIWHNTVCLNWRDTIEWFKLYDITPVPIIYKGIFNEEHLIRLSEELVKEGKHEGYVIRVENSFKHEQFRNCVAKFVRKNHVQTDQHWMHKQIIKNTLINETANCI